MIEHPPAFSVDEFLAAIRSQPRKEIVEIVDEINDNYLYWTEVKYKKLPDDFTHKELWTYVKAARIKGHISVWDRYGIQLTLTSHMQRLCHEFDMNFGGSWGTNSIIPEESKNQYLISSLMEEAISSSQMEGAATTRKVAKEMLRKKSSPRDKSQQMILNNYQTIQFIVENKDKPLSEELLLKIHHLMTEKTLDNAEDEGRFRTNNDIVVEDGITHDTVHTPPSFEDIPHFVQSLCQFFNEEHSRVFIHPIIRGIIIHFMMAYVHPFVDGNGRTARALFYWYMLKRGYWLTEYMSISRVIARSKKTYEKSYLFTECDENDIGYFVQYNLGVLEKAFAELQLYIKRKQEEKKQTNNKFLKIGDINERQAQIIRILDERPDGIITVKELQNRFDISPTKAKNDIIGFVNKNLIIEISFNKVKKGYVKSADFDKIIAKI